MENVIGLHMVELYNCYGKRDKRLKHGRGAGKCKERMQREKDW